MARSFVTGDSPSVFDTYCSLLARLVRDDSGAALVEYCIVMATLTVLMMIAYRNIGASANNTAGRNVNSMTNSSVVAP